MDQQEQDFGTRPNLQDKAIQRESTLGSNHAQTLLHFFLKARRKPEDVEWLNDNFSAKGEKMEDFPAYRRQYGSTSYTDYEFSHPWTRVDNLYYDEFLHERFGRLYYQLKGYSDSSHFIKLLKDTDTKQLPVQIQKDITRTKKFLDEQKPDIAAWVKFLKEQGATKGLSEDLEEHLVPEKLIGPRVTRTDVNQYLLDKYGFDLGAFELELYPQAAKYQAEMALQLIDRIKAMGFKINSVVLPGKDELYKHPVTVDNSCQAVALSTMAGLFLFGGEISLDTLFKEDPALIVGDIKIKIKERTEKGYKRLRERIGTLGIRPWQVVPGSGKVDGSRLSEQMDTLLKRLFFTNFSEFKEYYLQPANQEPVRMYPGFSRFPQDTIKLGERFPIEMPNEWEVDTFRILGVPMYGRRWQGDEKPNMNLTGSGGNFEPIYQIPLGAVVFTPKPGSVILG